VVEEADTPAVGASAAGLGSTVGMGGIGTIACATGGADAIMAGGAVSSEAGTVVGGRAGEDVAVEEANKLVAASQIGCHGGGASLASRSAWTASGAAAGAEVAVGVAVASEVRREVSVDIKSATC